MPTEAKGCCAPPRATARGFVGSGLGIALAAAAALLPKCPLCFAGYLTLVGLSTATATAIAPLLVPAAAALAVTTVTWCLMVGVHRRLGIARTRSER